MKLFFSDAYVRSGYSFDTVRKAAWIAQSLQSDPITGVDVVEPVAATSQELDNIHAADYVRAVRTGSPRHLAESQGFPWDPGVWKSTTTSTGGCIAAAFAALDDGVAGSLSSGLHHARHGRGSGFCTFNGLALAACAVIAARSAKALVLDLDAHCGGGTASLIADHHGVSQLDVAVNRFDAYSPVPGRCTLDIVCEADRYLETVRLRLAAGATDVDLVLYNAGMDPFEGCDIGGLSGITESILAERERMVFQWAASQGLPIAFVIAGGYVGKDLSPDKLVALHRHTIASAASAE